MKITSKGGVDDPTQSPSRQTAFQLGSTCFKTRGANRESASLTEFAVRNAL